MLLKDNSPKRDNNYIILIIKIALSTKLNLIIKRMDSIDRLDSKNGINITQHKHKSLI